MPIHVTGFGSSRSSQLVGRVPPVPEAQDGTVEQETPRVSVGKPHRHLRQDQLPEEDREDHHPPHQNDLEEQIQMITQQPVSLVEATGIRDTGRWKEDWYQRD